MVKPRTPAGQHGLIYYRKTTSGKIEARTRYRHDNGRLALIQATGKSKTAARLALEEKLAGLTIDTSGELTADSTIKALAAVWAEANQEKKLAHNTRTRYTDLVERYIVPALGDLTLHEISTGRLTRFIKSVQTDSPTNAKHCRLILSQMFSIAVTHDALTRNPADGVPAVTVQRKKETRALTPAEARELRGLLSERTRPVYDLMLGTGLRISEALGVAWADMNLAEGVLVVRGAVKRSPDGLVREQPKSAGSLQTIPLPEFVVSSLGKVQELSEWVFPSTSGGLWDPSNFRKEWRRQVAGSGFEWVTPHTVRATVATQVAKAGSLADASALLGHSSESMTLKHYVEKDHAAPNVSGLLEVFG